MNVLLTDARLRTCLYVTQSLAQKNIDVYGGESAWLSPHFCDPNKVLTFKSKYCKGYFFYPHFKDETPFISYISKLSRYYDALIPINEDTIIPISKHADKFSNVLLPDYKDILKASDKGEVAKLCLKLDIPIPRTYFPVDTAQVEQLGRNLQYPAFIKWRNEGMMYPRYRISRSNKELLAYFSAMSSEQESPIIQEGINGFGVGFFGLFDRDHHLKAYFIHRRIREYPISGGPSSCCESYWNEKVFEYGLKLFKALNWRGVGMVEFKLDIKDNTPKVLEVNPRFWGSLPLAILSGVNFPYLLYMLITNQDFNPVMHYKLGVKCHFKNDFLSLWETLKTGDRRLETIKNAVSSIGMACPDLNLKDPRTSIRQFSRAR